MASKVSGYIGKINPGNGTQYSLGSTAYGYCETEAATAAKTVDMTGFILTEGATIFIKFKYNNTATDDPTLNVATTGAKPLIPKTWYAGAILSLTYDGTSWVQANAYLDASTITSGTLPTGRGGTGNTSYDANRVIYSESASKLSATGHYTSSSKLAINSTSEPTENFYVNGTTGLNGATSHKAGHIYLEGSQASQSTGNTTQIVFGTPSSQHIALSSNSGAFIINPTTSSTTGQIVLKPGATSYISSGRLTINAAGNDSYNLYVNGTSRFDGCVILNTTTAASNFNAPSLKVIQNAEISSANVNHMAQFLASNMTDGGANAIVLGKAVSSNQAGGLMYTHGGTGASSLSFGFINNLGLLKITSTGSIYINSGSSSTNNTKTSELLVKGRVVVDPSYHNTNNFSEFRINRSTAGWSAITLGGAQGTTSGAGLGVWLIGNQNTPNDATTAAASITDSQFYISYSKAANATCRIQGHNADGFSIRPRLAVNADVDTVNADYNLYVNGTSQFTGGLESGGTIYPTTDKTADLGSATARWKNIHVGYISTYPIAVNGTITQYNEILCKNNSKNLVGALIYDSGSATNVTTGRWIFQEYSPNSTANASTTGKYEWYQLPAVTAGLTANKTYDILTSKNAVTIAQGGTGATTAAAARANLGALGSKLVGSFEGMTTMSGDDTKWIRTTTVGIIPYENGDAGSGHSALGAATWYFADAYVDHMHGVDIVTNQAGAGQGLQIQSNSKRVAQLYLYTRGTTSVAGSAQFILGNNIATGTAENAAGMIQIHGTNTGYHRIQPTASTSNYNHYLPNAKGWIATGGNGTSTGVGSASQPVYLSSAGVLTACQIDANIAVISYAGTGTDSVTLEFPFAPTIVIACGGGAIVDASSGWSGVHSNGVAGAGSLICAMAKVPVAASISAVANNDTYGTNSVGKGLAYVVGKIESALPDTKYTSCIGKSSNGKKLFIKWFGAAPGPVGSAGAAYIFNLSGNTYHFLAIK